MVISEIRELQHTARKNNIDINVITVSPQLYDHLVADMLDRSRRACEPIGVLRLDDIEIRKRACNGCCRHG